MDIEESLKLIMDRLDELCLRIDKPDRTYSIREVCKKLAISRSKLLTLNKKFHLNIQIERKNGCNPVITYDQYCVIRKCLEASVR